MMPVGSGPATVLAMEAAQMIASLCPRRSYTFNGWSLLDLEQNVLLSGEPAFLVQGTAGIGDDNGNPSKFLTFLGQTHPPDFETRKGHTRAMVWVSDAWAVLPGRPWLDVASVGLWNDFAMWLDAHPALFADRWGRKCKVLPQCSLRFHSVLQSFRGA